MNFLSSQVSVIIKSCDAPQGVQIKACWQGFARQADIFIKSDINFLTVYAWLGFSAHLVTLSLCADCFFVACLYNLNLIFLSRNRHLIKIFLSLFKDALHAEKRLQEIGLEKFVYLSVDFLDLLDLEAKDVASRELACL